MNGQQWIAAGRGNSKVRRGGMDVERAEKKTKKENDGGRRRWWRLWVGGMEGEEGEERGRVDREPTAMRTLWRDNEEVPRCQPTPFTLHGSDPKVSTS